MVNVCLGLCVEREIGYRHPRLNKREAAKEHPRLFRELRLRVLIPEVDDVGAVEIDTAAEIHVSAIEWTGVIEHLLRDAPCVHAKASNLVF